MIIIRYLVRETFKSQVAILFILLLIFLCQKMMRILGSVVDGDIPTNLIFSLLGLAIPTMIQLILPLSLFLALLMTLGKLYSASEITVMYACGLGKNVLLKGALILAGFTSILALGNIFWLSPWSSFYIDEVVAESKANPGMAALVEGQFQSTKDGNYVMFISNVKDATFSNVFLAQLRLNGSLRPSVLMAEQGRLQSRPDGSLHVVLDKGTRYEGSAILRDFRITHFADYEAIVGYQPVDLTPSSADQASIKTLWDSPMPEFRAEFHWRLTLVFSIFVMALMVVPLSVVNPRQGRTLSMLPAMLLYLIFFLLQSVLRSNAGSGQLNPLVWMWMVNGVYLLLAILLNMWDTLPMRRLREGLARKGVV